MVNKKKKTKLENQNLMRRKVVFALAIINFFAI
jgi:hypothetical protein